MQTLNDRIILDFYVKEKKNLLPGSPKGPANKIILAVNAMYGWLYDQGILQRTAFEFRDCQGSAEFALDVSDLAKYRPAMERSGVKDADLAIHRIFDMAFTPCAYSGAIQLSWPMQAYRSVSGCVSTSWECGLVQLLNLDIADEIAKIQREDGTPAAVQAVFQCFNWNADDISQNNRPIIDEGGVETLGFYHACRKCGERVANENSRTINFKTDKECRICEACFDSLWDANDITCCANCGEWFEVELLSRPDPNKEFTPCPACGHDVVEGYCAEESNDFEPHKDDMTYVEENIVNISMMAAGLIHHGKIQPDELTGHMGMTQEIIRLAKEFEKQADHEGYRTGVRDYWEEIDDFAQKHLIEIYGVE